MRNIFHAFVAIALSMAVLGCNSGIKAPAPVGGSGTVEGDDGYDVFLLIGQSNMAGRGTMIAGDENVFSENVYILNAEGEPESASNPLNKYSTIRKSLSMQQINPGFSFSRKIAAETGRKILLVVNARGGTSVSEWAVAGEYYSEAVRRTEQALKYGRLKAILWHQGEADSSSPETYLDRLAVIVDSLRKDLDAPQVPFIAGEIAGWHRNAARFNPVIRRISGKIPYSDYVSSEGCTPLKDTSDPHFGRDGQILLGERYAGKVLEMCYGGCIGRVVRSVNESWKFCREGESDTVAVNLPHTWNNIDSQDETPGYYRGKGIYAKTLMINEDTDGRSFFLHFEGANQVAEVFVNGRSAGVHKGGYTAFCLDVTDMVRKGGNSVKVIVDNSFDADIPPLSADFTFFGGIYRDVSLIITPDVHISPTHYATSGVYVSTECESRRKAVVRICTRLSNDSPSDETVVLTQTVLDPSGKPVASGSRKIRIPAGKENHLDSTRFKIKDPVLWSMDTPGIYRVVTVLSDETGKKKDMVSERFGIRWFSFDPDEGFSLNGKYTKLMGTNRHQDYYLKGNALADEMHVRDVRLLKDMGGNFLRISHYPQDPVVTQMCDRYGIVASVEIPVVNAVTVSEEFRENCVRMAEEMVWQDFNSPSVVMWAYMNEVLLRPPYDDEDEAGKKAYIDFLYSVAEDIENTIKKIDPDRYTMLPCHSNPALYNECGISRLPDILGWNLYNGWYGGGFDGFRKTLDKLHAMYPEQSLLVTEYGADVDPRLHSFEPERFDFSCEYGLMYHHHYIPEILSRKWLAGTTVWNLNSFYSESRRDAVPHVNSKGITGLDRERKDTYYLYRTWLSDKPELRIGGHGWKIRGGVPDSTGVCPQPVEVYSNASQIRLYHNGNDLGMVQTDGMTAVFEVPFTDGENILKAVAEKDGIRLEDILSVDFRMVPAVFDGSLEFTEMNVMLGSRRYFEDRTAEMVWIPEQEYTAGSWGYTGGEAVRTKTRHGSLPCSDIDILNTDQDPVFQTQREGLEGFRADVPDGRYYVYLYFAELVSDSEKEVLAYNLGNDAIREAAGEREFDVTINGVKVLKDFNIARECGPETAVVKKFTVDAYGGEGLDIRFIPRKGSPVLNAVRIYRCF